MTSMEFEFYPKIGELKHVLPRATCKILKHGEIEVSGSFRLVLESAVTHVARVGERKLASIPIEVCVKPTTNLGLWRLTTAGRC